MQSSAHPPFIHAPRRRSAGQMEDILTPIRGASCNGEIVSRFSKFGQPSMGLKLVSRAGGERSAADAG